MAAQNTQDELVAHFRLPLSAIVEGKEACVTITADAPANELPALLSSAHASFAAVVDEEGNFVDGVSVFDLLARARAGRHLVKGALVDEEEHNAELAAAFDAATVGDLVGSYSISNSNPEFRIAGSLPTRSTFHKFAMGMHYQLVVPDEYAPGGVSAGGESGGEEEKEDGMVGEEEGKEGGEVEEGGVKTPAEVCVLLEKKDILAFALAHMSQLAREDQLGSEIGSMGLFYSRAPSIPASTRAADAFEELYNEKADGIAIVSDDGILMGNLSVSDAKIITGQNFKDLSLPILDFLQANGRLRDPVSCTKSATFAEVMDLYVSSSVSRLWVVDEASKLIGICPMSRLMSLFHRL